MANGPLKIDELSKEDRLYVRIALETRIAQVKRSRASASNEKVKEALQVEVDELVSLLGRFR